MADQVHARPGHMPRSTTLKNVMGAFMSCKSPALPGCIGVVTPLLIRVSPAMLLHGFEFQIATDAAALLQ